MSKTSFGFADLTITRREKTYREMVDAASGFITRKEEERERVDRILATNVAVRANIRLQTIGMFANNDPGSNFVTFWPWRLPQGWDGGETGPMLRAVALYGGTTWGGYQYCYPAGTADSDTATSQTEYASIDPRRMRAYLASGSTGGRLMITTPDRTSRVFGAIAYSGYFVYNNGERAQADGMVFVDIPYTMIGTAYGHPMYGRNITTVAGQSYVTGSDYWITRLGGIVRIDSGPDKGIYRAHSIDRTNNWLYLQNLDGTMFVAQQSATVAGADGPRLAHFNETNVIPNGVGAASFDGQFDPGENRTSYIFRIRYEKTGSPSGDAHQRGSYWLGLKPWLYGDGGTAGTITHRRDYNHVTQSSVPFRYLHTQMSTGYTGGCHGQAFDAANQRMWFVVGDGTKGALGFWRYKSPEVFHEIANSVATTPNHDLGIVSGTSVPRSVALGSDGTLYATLTDGSRNGWLKVTPDLSAATHVLTTDVGLAANLRCFNAVVDKSRFRTGTAGDVVTNAGTNQIDSASAGFTAADVGRVIKLTGGTNDDGTYKIATRVSATRVTVQTLAGAAVSFTGGTGGTFSIGDRIYLFFYDTAVNVGKMSYFESLAFGVLFQQNVAMTNGARNYDAGNKTWSTAELVACVDQSNGVVYWLSNDTVPQINRFDPTTGLVASRAVSAFNGLNGGAGTIVDPTSFLCVGLNPHPSFRELWLGTNAGWVKLNPDDFTGAFSRYYGSGSDATPYSKPAGFPRPDGSITTTGINSRSARWIGFGIDGRVYGQHQEAAESRVEWVLYNREQDCFTSGSLDGQITGTSDTIGSTSYQHGTTLTPYGEFFINSPFKQTDTNMREHTCIVTCGTEIHYQWIGGVWTPKEVVRGTLPGTLSPGCAAKPLHTTLDELVMGVRVKFTPQGGATPANNEYLGRIGQLSATRADGAWNATGVAGATQAFNGSGFVADNVGDYIWIESGADTGVYQVVAFANANQVTVRKMNGAAFTPSQAGAVNYSIWTMGALAGPEILSVLAASGVAKDNTQDVTNIKFEAFHAKTLISEEQEGVKFTVDPPGPKNSAGVTAHFEAFAGSFGANMPQGRALPGVTTGLARWLLDGGVKRPGDGQVGTPNTSLTNTSGAFFGRHAASGGNFGLAVSVDLGAEVEVGSVIFRGRESGSYFVILNARNAGGAITNIHKASGAAPTAAIDGVARTSGTGLSCVTPTIAASHNLGNPGESRHGIISAGDFLGAIVTTGGDGQVTAGGNRLTSVPGAFQAGYVGHALKVTSGADAGAYRIMAVAADGSWVDVRNLDQTTRTWGASASAVPWEVRNAVREEDILSSGGQYLTVERLLTPTTVEFRVAPSVTMSNWAWTAFPPTWDLVKRVSYSCVAQPPDVVGNGTYMSGDPYEDCKSENGYMAVADLSDLSAAQRTGRYWKFSMMSRFGGAAYLGSATNPGNGISSFELYDTAGKLITTCRYNKLDAVDELAAAFVACHVTRLDYLQATPTAAAHVAGSNGTATVGGALADTITLDGGGRFLGYEVRRGARGSTVGGNGVWNVDTGGTDATVHSGDVTRVLRIITGPNAGFYKIATVTGTTGVTVTTMNGAAVTFAADAGPSEWAIHEGWGLNNVYDVIRIGSKESIITAFSDDMKTITVADHFLFTPGAGKAWEIRKRRFPDAGIGYTQNAAADAYGSGTVNQDHRGYLQFPLTDTVNAPARTDGATTAGGGTFTGTQFTPDDVGRMIVIHGGADVGRYEIATFVSATQITVKDLDTGEAVAFSASATGLTYRVHGERRFKLVRYATVLRS